MESLEDIFSEDNVGKELVCICGVGIGEFFDVGEAYTLYMNTSGCIHVVDKFTGSWFDYDFEDVEDFYKHFQWAELPKSHNGCLVSDLLIATDQFNNVLRSLKDANIQTDLKPIFIEKGSVKQIKEDILY